MILKSLPERAQSSATFLWRLTWHWPWDIVDKKYWSPTWRIDLLQSLSARAHVRYRCGFDDRNDIASLQASSAKYRKSRTAEGYRGVTHKEILQCLDVKRAGRELNSKEGGKPQHRRQKRYR